MALNSCRTQSPSRLLTVLREAKAPQEEQAVVQPGEQREAAVERVVPEEELEHGGLLRSAGSPVRVRHGEVVQVGQEWRDPVSEGPLCYPTRVCGRRCHVFREPRCLGLEVRRQASKRETVQTVEHPTSASGRRVRAGVRDPRGRNALLLDKCCKTYRFFAFTGVES